MAEDGKGILFRLGIEMRVRVVTGGHGLRKVSLGLALPYPSTPSGRATSGMALWSFLGCLARRADALLTPWTPMLK